MGKMPYKPILTLERNNVLSGHSFFYLCQCMFLVKGSLLLFYDCISTYFILIAYELQTLQYTYLQDVLEHFTSINGRLR